MKIYVCDYCGNQIPDEARPIEIMLRGMDEHDPEAWTPLDLCGVDCVSDVFGIGVQGNDEPAEAELPKLKIRRKERQPEGMDDGLSDELYEEDAPDSGAATYQEPSELTLEQRSENEKRYKEEAAAISASMFPVKNKSKGER